MKDIFRFVKDVFPLCILWLIRTGWYNKSLSSAESLLTDVYHAIFGKNEKQTWEPIRIGRCALAMKQEKTHCQVASLLSNQAVYN